MSAEELQEKLKISDSKKCRIVLSLKDLDDELKNATQRKVLVGVDGSEFSKQAFDFYLNQIHRSGDIVVLSHTAELPPKPTVAFPEEKRQEGKQLLQEYVTMWQEKLGSEPDDKIVAVLDDKHFSPGEGIIALATDNNVAMIVIGTRGQGFIRRAILGSVSDYVIHHTDDIPVTVVPHSSD